MTNKLTRAATLFFCAFLAAGCGKIEDEVQDGSTVDQPTPPAANCVNLNENEYGCYGDDKVFHGTRIVDGVWSVYTQSNLPNAGNVLFYDRYEAGYDFMGDGGSFKRSQTADYNYFYAWGVNDAGTELRVADGNTYSYVAVFTNDAKCFEVKRNEQTVKFCNESYVDMTHENASGYYGDKVKFGNLTRYNFDAVGTWKIKPYERTGDETMVVLDANGSTSAGGEWGVAKDGKVMTIDGTSYLVYQYLSGSDSNCIAVFELSGAIITPTTWKLCKE